MELGLLLASGLPNLEQLKLIFVASVHHMKMNQFSLMDSFAGGKKIIKISQLMKTFEKLNVPLTMVDVYYICAKTSANDSETSFLSGKNNNKIDYAALFNALDYEQAVSMLKEKDIIESMVAMIRNNYILDNEDTSKGSSKKKSKKKSKKDSKKNPNVSIGPAMSTFMDNVQDGKISREKLYNLFHKVQHLQEENEERRNYALTTLQVLNVLDPLHSKYCTMAHTVTNACKKQWTKYYPKDINEEEEDEVQSGDEEKIEKKKKEETKTNSNDSNEDEEENEDNNNDKKKKSKKDKKKNKNKNSTTTDEEDEDEDDDDENDAVSELG